jgi:hypothetical protein
MYYNYKTTRFFTNYAETDNLFCRRASSFTTCARAAGALNELAARVGGKEMYFAFPSLNRNANRGFLL